MNFRQILYQWLNRYVLFLSLLASPLIAQAQDAKGKVMMVLDGSNSMWGQIEGVATITYELKQ
ncbi:MAG: hypothetical protein AAFZ04_06725 [Pseudomonadota bacterium]